MKAPTIEDVARIRLEHLTKDFTGVQGGPIRAVTDLSLAVEEKELVALVGPSGSGKTTVLRLIAGLEEPTSGTVCIDGRDMSAVAPKDRDIAMVFQHPALYPHLSVFENMAFGLRLRGAGKDEVRQRVHETAEILGLKDCLERKPEPLSGGQRQRVALGRALVRRPKVFLLDEPLSNLDASTRAQLRAEICRLHAASGSTMIYVTHDQQEANALGNRVAVLNAGRLQQMDTPLSVYRVPANRFVAGFIGYPPMNFFFGSLVRESRATLFQAAADGTTPETAFRFRLEEALAGWLAQQDGKQIVLGIRPEDVCRVESTKTVRQEESVGAVVERVEVTGPEMYIHFRAGSHRFVGREVATEEPKRGERANVRFVIERAHLFDAQTGARLGSP